MQDAALRWLVDVLKTFGLSEDQARWIVIPFYVVVIFFGLAGLLSFVLPMAWSLAIPAWLVFVWACWVPFSPRLFRNEWLTWIAVLVIPGLVTIILIQLWILAGWSSLRGPFFASVFLWTVVLIANSYKPLLLPLLAQVISTGFFTLLLIFLIVSWQHQQHAIGRSPPDRIGIWVARFDLDMDGQVQAGIIEQLNHVLRAEPLLKAVVEVRDLRRAITGEPEAVQFSLARQLGREIHGSIVVFGRVTRQGLATKIAVVHQPYGFGGSELTRFVRDITDIPSLDVKATYLVTKVITGLIYFLKGNCPAAESQFGAVLAEIGRIEEVLLPESLRLYQARSIMCAAETQGGVERLRQAQAIYLDLSRSAMPITAAQSDAGLGLIYRRLSEYEEPVDNLSRAVVAYEQALGRLPSDADSELISIVQTNLGVAYEKLSEYRDRDENLSRAMAAHQQSLQGIDPGKNAHNYALTMNNLAVAYKRLAVSQHPRANLKRAIEASNTGLTALSLDHYWERMSYCRLKDTLGDAHSRLSQHEDAGTNLKRAVQAFEEALAHCARAEDAALFAEVHFHLGRAFIMQDGRSSTPNFRKGVSSLACSLVVFDELNMGYHARIVAVDLRNYMQTLVPNQDQQQLTALLQSQQAPSACVFRPEQVWPLIEKWAPK